jgi:thiosulfate/3-mercaptopyruvate sulfurtransferase
VLAARVGDPHVHVIDLRSQPEYNTAHVPASVCLSVESVRGVVGNVSSMLLPRDMLARHFSLIGILPTDTVVFVPGDKVHDATMAAMA